MKKRYKWIFLVCFMCMGAVVLKVTSFAKGTSREMINCSTYAELSNALKKSGTVRISLSNDIHVTNRMYVTEGEKYVYGNGHWLINDTQTGNYSQCSLICSGKTADAYLYVENLKFDGNNRKCISYMTYGGSNGSANLIYQYGGRGDVEGCEFYNSQMENYAGDLVNGAAAAACGGDVTFTSCTFANSVRGLAACANEGHSVVVNECIFRNNEQYGILASSAYVYLKGGSSYENGTNGIQQLSGKVKIRGGEFHGNGNHGIYIQNGEMLLDTSVYSNEESGVLVEGNAAILGGTYENNANYDIYHSGTALKMQGSINMNTQGIYLDKGRFIDITGRIECEDKSIKVTLPLTDILVGRLVAVTSYDKSEDATRYHLNKFSLTNTYTATDTTQKMSNQMYKRVAHLRSGTGTNSEVGTIILSEEYYVTFQNTLVWPEVNVKMPEKKTVYWKEDINIDASVQDVYLQNKNISKSLFVSQWNTKEDGTGENYAFTFSIRPQNDVTLFTMWNANFDLTYCGNHQTKGEDYKVTYVKDGYEMAQNIFERQEKDNKYSFYGWAFTQNHIYKNPDIYKAGEKIDPLLFLQTANRYGCAFIDSQGRFQVNTYVVWDQYPVIHGKDLYLYENQIAKITQEQLLNQITAEDLEDGRLKKGEAVKVIDFTKEDYQNLGNGGYGTITYQATDAVGNVSYYFGKLFVTSENAEVENKSVRHIDEENYYKTEKMGGLQEASVWYEDEEYKNAILDAFERLKRKNYLASYTFSSEKIKKIQDDVKKNGFGKTKNEDALHDFYFSCIK